jgi:hypothetical protein
MSRARNLNEPENWLRWLRACLADEGNPIRVPVGLKLGAITGQDRRVLGAVASCWSLYASSDDDGRHAALASIASLLHALQPQCHPFARELIAQSLDWSDRARLWPLVRPLAAVRKLCSKCGARMDEATLSCPDCPQGEGEPWPTDCGLSCHVCEGPCRATLMGDREHSLCPHCDGLAEMAGE